MTLEEALTTACAMEGCKILEQPNRLLGVVLDLCDEESLELRVFANNCVSEFCAPFAEATGKQPPRGSDFVVAAQQAERYLVQVRTLNVTAARATSLICARAAARACGVSDPRLAPPSEPAMRVAPTTAEQPRTEPVAATHHLSALEDPTPLGYEPDAPTRQWQVPQMDSTEHLSHPDDGPLANANLRGSLADQTSRGTIGGQTLRGSLAGQTPHAVRPQEGGWAASQTAPQPAAPAAPVPQKRRNPAIMFIVLIALLLAIAAIVFVALRNLPSNAPTSTVEAGSGATDEGKDSGEESGGDAPSEEPAVEEVLVPPTEGLSLDSALSVLKSAGLKAKVEEEESDKTPQTVLSSSPVEGTVVEKGSTVTLLVAKAREQVEEEPKYRDDETSPTDTSYGPATFSSTSYMSEVWDFFPYYDRTPQTIHAWMLDNGFWLDSYHSGCAIYRSQYNTEFTYTQGLSGSAYEAGLTGASSNDQSPLLAGMTWRVMRVHFFGEGLDYAIDKCHLDGESWRGTASGLGTPSSDFMRVPSDAEAARGSKNGYAWEAAYDPSERYCTVVVRIP